MVNTASEILYPVTYKGGCRLRLGKGRHYFLNKGPAQGSPQTSRLEVRLYQTSFVDFTGTDSGQWDVLSTIVNSGPIFRRFHDMP